MFFQSSSVFLKAGASTLLQSSSILPEMGNSLKRFNITWPKTFPGFNEMLSGPIAFSYSIFLGDFITCHSSMRATSWTLLSAFWFRNSLEFPLRMGHSNYLFFVLSTTYMCMYISSRKYLSTSLIPLTCFMSFYALAICFPHMPKSFSHLKCSTDTN